MTIQIDYVDKLHPIFTKPKRIKIVVGGRASTKSTGVADYVAAKLSIGELWCCARETQNSIEESVHRTILDEIDRIGLIGFEDTKTSITHTFGGRTFYRGLSRNITSLKSTLSGVDGLWIEEGEDLSDNTIRVLTASVRLNATDSERLIAGEDVKMPEIIITMNRGIRSGAVAKKWLARAEPELQRCGYYEDDTVMVVQMNYTDMPKAWFEASGLEQERLDDKDRLSVAAYNHKWHGHYLDEVENSLVKPEWFDAAIDAHKLPRLADAFKPYGAVIAAHDPFDDGGDAGGFAVRHGSIIKEVRSKTSGEIDQVCDWAVAKAKAAQADWFVFDGDGMGAGLKRQVSLAFDGTRTSYYMFRGSLSGSAQDRAKEVYQKGYGSNENNPKTYADTFYNNRAQNYVELANRFYNTYKCVIRGEYVAPEDMISIESTGVDDMDSLRSQICTIPLKENDRDLIQLLSKKEMKRLGIQSPNEGDSVMMTMFTPKRKSQVEAIEFEGWG